MPSSPRAPPAVLTRPRSRFVETDGSFVGSSSSLEVRHRLAATADSASGPSSAWSGRQARKEKEAERKDSKDSRDSRETKDGKDRKNSSHGSEGFDSGNKVAYSPSSTLPTGHVESGPKGRHYKSWPGVPYLQRPIKGDGPWLLPGRNASKWLNLFYDLAVASVLSTFANAHELGHPAAIPTFLSYFIIIQWMWATQTYYDIRFQAEDVVHRVFKAIQIFLFVYIGAASRNWDLSLLKDPDVIPGISNQAYTGRELTIESFTTVVIAFLVSKGLLAMQYIMSAILAQRAGRKIAFQLSSAIALVISTALTIVCVALPTTTDGLIIAKIFLLYLSILWEFVLLVIQLRPRYRHHISVAAIAERYGALTLVILGEGGFNSLTRGFNFALSAFSDDSKSIYGQVFLAVGIMFMLYLFLYSWFDPEEEITERRALAWQALHLPLHLGILLLLAAMVNTVIVLSYAHGLDVVAELYLQTVEGLQNGTMVNAAEQDEINKYLSRLKLEPSWDDQFGAIKDMINSAQPAYNASIVIVQYFGQVLAATTTAYGLPVSTETFDVLGDLYSINSTYTSDLALTDSRLHQASVYVAEILSEPISAALSGTLWLFPCAGAVLILAAVRSFIWYRIAGIDHYVLHASMAISGVALSLLGFLAVGKTKIRLDLDSTEIFYDMDKIAPMYVLVVYYAPLAIVLGVYALVYFGAAIFMGCMRRKRERQEKPGAPAIGTTEKGV